MAYGTIKQTYYTTPLTYLSVNGSSQYFKFTYPVNTVKNQSEFRSGTNASVKPFKKVPKVVTGYKLVKRYRKLYLGKRTAVKVWSKKLGKWVYSRESYILSPYLARLPVYSRHIPKFKGLDLPPNQLTYGKVKVTVDSPSTIHCGYGGGKNYYFNGWTAHEMMSGYTVFGPHPQNEATYVPSIIAASLADSLSTKAYNKLLDKIKNSKVNLAQAMGERKQTAALILDLGSKVANAIRDLKRGNLTSALKSLVPKDSKQLANDWLQYQYGLRPLLSDLEGAVELLKTDQKFVYDVVVTRKENFGPVPKTDMQNSSGKRNDSFYNVVWDTTVFGNVIVKYKARIRITSPGMQSFTSTGLTNPLALLWELTPWSFVADWFLPIGDYLNKIDSLTGIEVMYAHKSVLTHEYVTQTKRFYGLKNAGQPDKITGVSSVTYDKVYFQRIILPSLPSAPIPKLSDSPLNLTRSLNALALLRQLRK